jgi:hypothetical protein
MLRSLLEFIATICNNILNDGRKGNETDVDTMQCTKNLGTQMENGITHSKGAKRKDRVII